MDDDEEGGGKGAALGAMAARAAHRGDTFDADSGARAARNAAGGAEAGARAGCAAAPRCSRAH